MSRTSQTLTNTDLAFLLCTLTTTSPQSQSQGQFPKVSRSFSFETNYGLALSLDPDDGSITIRLRELEPQTAAPCPNPMSKNDQYAGVNLANPFDSATPIQSQQQFQSHGSIDGVLLSGPYSRVFGMTTSGTGATIMPARSAPPSRLPLMPTPTMTRTSDRKSPLQEMANRAGVSNLSDMKIRYYIRPFGLEVNSSSHMYYTASASSSSTQPHHQPQPHPHLQPTYEPGAASNNTKPTFTKPRPRTRTPSLHRVKLSHLQSLYHAHLPSSTGAGTSSSRKSTSSSSSWFDAYLDWIDRLDDALTTQQQLQQQQTLQTAQTTRASRQVASVCEPQGQTNGTINQGGPFTDSGERCLWLVEGMLLASWLLLQEGVEGVEYRPLSHMSAESGTESGMEDSVYRLEKLPGIENGMGMGNGGENNAGVMMKRLLEVVGAGA